MICPDSWAALGHRRDELRWEDAAAEACGDLGVAAEVVVEIMASHQDFSWGLGYHGIYIYMDINVYYITHHTAGPA